MLARQPVAQPALSVSCMHLRSRERVGVGLGFKRRQNAAQTDGLPTRPVRAQLRVEDDSCVHGSSRSRLLSPFIAVRKQTAERINVGRHVPLLCYLRIQVLISPPHAPGRKLDASPRGAFGSAGALPGDRAELGTSPAADPDGSTHYMPQHTQSQIRTWWRLYSTVLLLEPRELRPKCSLAAPNA